MAKVGRPTKYTLELADKICTLIADGKSMRTISKEIDLDMSSIFAWLREHKEFSDQYARAKQEQAEALVEDMHAIADESIEFQGDGLDNVRVNAQKLRVDTRKWIASKLKPKKYGERLQHANDENNPMPQMVLYCPKEEKTDD